MASNTNSKDLPSHVVSSFNMHGFNQGLGCLNSLCNTQELFSDIIFIQEHWLSPSNMHKILSNSANYSAYGISAMEECLSKGVLKGRPWGGVCTIVNNKFQSSVKVLKCAERFVVIEIGEMLFINVYLPKICNEYDYSIVHEIFIEIESLFMVNPSRSIIIGGDFNARLDVKSPSSDYLNSFLENFGVIPCHKLISSNLNYTFHRDATSQFSYIDYICISKGYADSLVNFKVQDVFHNLSDHLPISAQFNLKFSLK